MGAVAEIERKLARSRCEQETDGVPLLRTSTMTHLVWAPPAWVGRARRVLAGLAERHPARTIFLVPLPGRRSEIETDATVRAFGLGGGREALSEVIEIRMRGDAARHPASLVLPLLISDLPAFCRWRGRPDWDGSAFGELVGVVDRLVVDSSEWSGAPAAPTRPLVGALRPRRDLRHRLAADAAVARRARRALAGDPESPASCRRGAARGRASPGRLAPFALASPGLAVAERRRGAAGGAGRRRAGRARSEPSRRRQRSPLSRARRVRPRPGLRGRGSRGSRSLSHRSSSRTASSRSA